MAASDNRLVVALADDDDANGDKPDAEKAAEAGTEEKKPEPAADKKPEEKPASDEKPEGKPATEEKPAAPADDAAAKAKAAEKAADAALRAAEDAKRQYEDDLKKYEDDVKKYDDKVKAGKEQVAKLNRRFADWYYVISAESFNKLHVARKDIIKAKTPVVDGSAAPKVDAAPKADETPKPEPKRKKSRRMRSPTLPSPKIRSRKNPNRNPNLPTRTKGRNRKRQNPRTVRTLRSPTPPNPPKTSDPATLGSVGPMSRLYLDNAATSFPKPEAVYRAVEDCLRNVGSAHGRSGTRGAMTVQSLVERARGGVARLIGATRPDRVVFTASGTDGLNLVLRGLLRPGDHVVAGSVEHNSVLRPLRALETAGVRLSVVHPRRGVVLDAGDVREAMRPDTRLIVVQHASNVTGELQPVEEIADLAHSAGAFVLVDAAQTVGSIPLNVRALGCDFLAAPAHKGLLAPLGTGFVWFGDGLEDRVESLRQGGTGTSSELEIQPSTMPDKYEAGNPNGRVWRVWPQRSLGWRRRASTSSPRGSARPSPGFVMNWPENPVSNSWAIPKATAGRTTRWEWFRYELPGTTRATRR